MKARILSIILLSLISISFVKAQSYVLVSLIIETSLSLKGQELIITWIMERVEI